MKTGKSFFVGNHRYYFRRDEIAEIIGIVTCYPDNHEPRVCFHIKYADGFEDYCPISDVGTYEILADVSIKA